VAPDGNHVRPATGWVQFFDMFLARAPP